MSLKILATVHGTPRYSNNPNRREEKYLVAHYLWYVYLPAGDERQQYCDAGGCRQSILSDMPEITLLICNNYIFVLSFILNHQFISVISFFFKDCIQLESLQSSSNWIKLAFQLYSLGNLWIEMNLLNVFIFKEQNKC